jgi:hypothetical protein
MRCPCGSRIINNYADRKIAISLHWVILAVCIQGVIAGGVSAQWKPAGSGKSPLCNRDNAVEMIKQQIDLTKTFQNPVPRIAVLIRAADMLWPYEQERARAAFTDAFELATENEKENEQKGPRSLMLRLQIPDQRYVVIRAVTKRDSAWAKELTQKMLKLDTEAREGTSTRNSFSDLLTAERLLDSAKQLIATDIKAAFDLATASLNYPATGALTRFLYRLAEVNQSAADQFYAQALGAYRDKPLREHIRLRGEKRSTHPRSTLTKFRRISLSPNPSNGSSSNCCWYERSKNWKGHSINVIGIEIRAEICCLG